MLFEKNIFGIQEVQESDSKYTNMINFLTPGKTIDTD